MMPEAVSTLTSKVEGKDIVWTIWRHIDAGKAADTVLRTVLNISWGDYAQFFKRLMAQYVATSTKNVLFTAHTMDILNEAEMVNETLVKVKGSLMNNGLESYFSTVISTKKLPTKKLENFKSPLLTFTPDEESDCYKYCFQTRLTKETVNERIRSSLGMWSIAETYVDNDIQLVLDRIHTYYK